MSFGRVAYFKHVSLFNGHCNCFYFSENSKYRLMHIHIKDRENPHLARQIHIDKMDKDVHIEHKNRLNPRTIYS